MGVKQRLLKIYGSKRKTVIVFSYIDRCVNYLNRSIIVLFVLFALYLLTRVFLFDQFKVSSCSMYPTIIPGDHILLNKRIFGARLYKQVHFEKGEIPWMSRSFCSRGIRYNDILVFNSPYPYGMKKSISFSLDKVYVKRCVGLPGDSISIVDGIIESSNFNDTIGYYPNECSLQNMKLPECVFYSLKKSANQPKWTILDFGPLYIPKKGAVVNIDSKNYLLYKKIIEYESEKKLTLNKKHLFLGERSISSYCFQENYYFMCGDNYSNSKDSRYWGFLPGKFIMGVISHILYSVDNDGKFRTNRFLKEL